MALQASGDCRSHYEYSKLTESFIDGFGVYAGQVPVNGWRGEIPTLVDFIHTKVDDIDIKNIVPKKLQRGCSLWITLADNH